MNKEIEIDCEDLQDNNQEYDDEILADSYKIGIDTDVDIDVDIESDMNIGMKEFFVTENDDSLRIDKWLHNKLPDVSRSQLQMHIANGCVSINGQSVKANYKIKNNDQIQVQFPNPEEVAITPEKIDIDIVYEDSDLIVVNKPRGMVVHPAQGHYSGTLVNALLYHCKDLSGINGELRPGIVHRIDKDTTGLLVAAKNDFTHKHLSEQFKEHTINRTYIALVHGLVPNKEGTIIAPIGRHKTQRKKMAVDVEKGKFAVSHFTVITHYNDYTLLEVKLETGRTHQIRVHMAYIGYPVAGDPVYGNRKSVSLKGQALHAKELGFVHPRSGEKLSFTVELPNDFKAVLVHL